jgi:hypothetical protein
MAKNGGKGRGIGKKTMRQKKHDCFLKYTNRKRNLEQK